MRQLSNGATIVSTAAKHLLVASPSQRVSSLFQAVFVEVPEQIYVDSYPPYSSTFKYGLPTRRPCCFYHIYERRCVFYYHSLTTALSFFSCFFFFCVRAMYRIVSIAAIVKICYFVPDELIRRACYMKSYLSLRVFMKGPCLCLPGILYRTDTTVDSSTVQDSCSPGRCRNILAVNPSVFTKAPHQQ